MTKNSDTVETLSRSYECAITPEHTTGLTHELHGEDGVVTLEQLGHGSVRVTGNGQSAVIAARSLSRDNYLTAVIDVLDRAD